MRLLSSNMRKLRKRPATWITFVLLVVLLGLIYLAIIASYGQTKEPLAKAAILRLFTFPEAYAEVLSLILGIGGLLAVAYGAAIAGSEWTWGTLKAAVARGESRSRYTLIGYLGVALMVVIGLVAVFVIGVILAAIGAQLLGVGLDGLGTGNVGDVGQQLGRAALSMSMNVAIGFAIATVARSQLAGIGVGIGLFFAEGVAGIFLPDVIKWFPFSAAGAVVAGGGGGAGAGGGQSQVRLDSDVAVVVVLAWLIGSLVVAALWTERAEIAG